MQRSSHTGKSSTPQISGITRQSFINEKRDKETSIKSRLITMRTIKRRPLDFNFRNLTKLMSHDRLHRVTLSIAKQRMKHGSKIRASKRPRINTRRNKTAKHQARDQRSNKPLDHNRTAGRGTANQGRPRNHN